MRQIVKDTLDGLKKLDLSTYPYEETRKLIGQLGKFGCILVTLHSGKTIMRARPNYNGERFLSKCELTCKPQQFNKTYQRASTPNRTMFYGSIIPENIEQGELDNARVIGAFEALPWLRNKSTKGYQQITFGRWIVNADINLLAIVQHDSYFNESSYTRELVASFKSFTQQYPELQDETLAISEYFAYEFSKEQTDNDYDYLISATFSEIVVDKGIDGVIFPSVRVGGKGFNVAIRPEIADTHLDLVVAGECSIYKYYDNSIVDNDTIVELTPNQTHFELNSVDPQSHPGQMECLRRLGLKSMDDLK